MKRNVKTLMAAVIVGLSASCVLAEGKADPAARAATPRADTSITATYPRLASSGLVYAKLAKLPDGTVLRAGELTVTEKEIASEIAKAPKNVRDQLRKNAFYLLEQLATRRLLLREAKARAAKAGKDVSKISERELLQDHFEKLTAGLKASDKEVADFYRQNKDMLGGAKLEQVKPQIRDFLLGQKKQQAVTEHIRTFGRRTAIEVSAGWAKKRAVLAKDNPVDKARSSRKPSFVNFGADGCRPCDMMSPIRETIKKKYAGKLNVLFVHVREHQILAARYGVRSIPVQVFYDQAGKEVFRHAGFFPQDEIEKKLAAMGVK